jgi:hypothetical protein
MDESPWATIRKGEPIDPRSLANRLRKYGISSKPQRVGEDVFKGYARSQFDDAWKRYVDDLDDDDVGFPLGGDLSVTSVTDDTATADGATGVTDVTDAKGLGGADQVEVDLFDEPSLNGHARCACGNQLVTPEAIATGQCKPCRDRERVR